MSSSASFRGLLEITWGIGSFSSPHLSRKLMIAIPWVIWQKLNIITSVAKRGTRYIRMLRHGTQNTGTTSDELPYTYYYNFWPQLLGGCYLIPGWIKSSTLVTTNQDMPSAQNHRLFAPMSTISFKPRMNRLLFRPSSWNKTWSDLTAISELYPHDNLIPKITSFKLSTVKHSSTTWAIYQHIGIGWVYCIYFV